MSAWRRDFDGDKAAFAETARRTEVTVDQKGESAIVTVSQAPQQFTTSDFFAMGVERSDPELAAAIRGEFKRQCAQIELIASENIVSRAVLDAQGSVLTNKYAEGYPNRRYYGGCEYVDVAERLAVDRAK
eukprot:gene12309-15668_t